MTASTFRFIIGSSVYTIEDWPENSAAACQERFAERVTALAHKSPSEVGYYDGHVVAFYEDVVNHLGDSKSDVSAALLHEDGGCVVWIGPLFSTDARSFIAGRVDAPTGPRLSRDFVRELATLHPPLSRLLNRGARISLGGTDERWTFLVIAPEPSLRG